MKKRKRFSVNEFREHVYQCVRPYAAGGDACEVVDNVSSLLRKYMASHRKGKAHRPLMYSDVLTACSAYSVALSNYGSRLKAQSAHEVGMLAALKAIGAVVPK